MRFRNASDLPTEAWISRDVFNRINFRVKGWAKATILCVCFCSDMQSNKLNLSKTELFGSIAVHGAVEVFAPICSTCHSMLSSCTSSNSDVHGIHDGLLPTFLHLTDRDERPSSSGTGKGIAQPSIRLTRLTFDSFPRLLLTCQHASIVTRSPTPIPSLVNT